MGPSRNQHEAIKELGYSPAWALRAYVEVGIKPVAAGSLEPALNRPKSAMNFGLLAIHFFQHLVLATEDRCPTGEIVVPSMGEHGSKDRLKGDSLSSFIAQ